MEDKAIEKYQRQMAAQYAATEKFRTNRAELIARRTHYSLDAVAEFKKKFWPADPFETGIMLDASYLEVAELAVIYKAATVLRDEGNEFSSNDLIVFKQSLDEKWEPRVKVNPLYLDAKRQRTTQINELFYLFFWGDSTALLRSTRKFIMLVTPSFMTWCDSLRKH